LTQKLEPRDASIAANAVKANLAGIFTGSDKVRQTAVKVAGGLGIKEVGPVLFGLVGEKDRPAAVRVEALQALAAMKDARVPEATKLALASEDAKLRAAGRRIQADREPAAAVGILAAALDKGETVEKQSALAALGSIRQPDADAIVSAWLDKLVAGQVPAELRLDVLESATRRASTNSSFQVRLSKYEATKAKDDPLASWRESMAGGDAERGRALFLTRSELSCVRCHKLNGVGGEVGPELAGIGGKQTREYLLESIVTPNKQIAKGFETVVLSLLNGKTVTGVLKSEDAKEIRLVTAEGQPITVKKADVDVRQSGKSAMPEDLIKSLTRSEMRDLVEFLAALK
jgi:quinoprotein glucose dehydrogenase